MVFDNYNNQYQRQMDVLDILNILSIIIQMDSLESDKMYKDYIQSFSAKIQDEINQLHVENEQIISKLDKILEGMEL